MEETELLLNDSEQNFTSNSFENEIKPNQSASSDESCGADDRYLFTQSKTSFDEQSCNNESTNNNLESSTLTCAVCGDISSGKHYGK